MLRNKPIKTILASAIGAILSINVVHAGSFSLYTESSAAALGNYGAGLAAEAADASTGWYNPAGLAKRYHQELVSSLVGLIPRSTITGTSTFTSAALPAPFNVYQQSFNHLQGAKDGLVPALHYSHPLGQDISFGLSVVAPFGLSTNWRRQTPVRYAATLSDLITADISPEIGGNITKNMSLGAGIDLQYARVKFNQVLGLPTLGQLPVPGLYPSRLDSYSYNRGNSFGVGFHTGVLLFSDDDHTRVGVNYQSVVRHKFHGHSRLTGPLATPGLTTITPFSALATIDALYKSPHLTSNVIEFPDIVTVSGYQDVNQHIALLGSVVYTGWHTLRSIALNNVAGFANGIGQAPVNSSTVEAYRNVWRVAAGVNYRLNEQWLFRAGTGYDKTPTVNADRDIRIADVDRIALAVGGHYQWRENLGVDVGYTHLFPTHKVSINKTNTVGAGNTYTINARASGSADLIGLQSVWQIDK